MNALRTRLRLVDRDENGLGLIEIVAAMLIFTIVTTGLLYSMMSVLTLNRESRTRQVAANLAAEEIDLARDVEDLFALLDRTRSVVLNGDTFTIKRVTRWISDPNQDLQCGAEGEALKYKRVNVSVSWANMSSTTGPVTSDTLIDPKNRVNDPALGTILVSVTNVAGTGNPNVTVKATPIENGAPISEAPKATDAQGCTYILRVKPGLYDVTVEKSGSVGSGLTTVSKELAQVVAGEATSVGFEIDQSYNARLRYASNYPGALQVPNNLQTTFLDPQGTVTVDQSTTPARDRTVKLLPFSSGYTILAGRSVPATDTTKSCLSPDPQAWEELKVKGDRFIARRVPTKSARAGQTIDVDVPMGVVQFDSTLIALGGDRLTAVSAKADNKVADPGCESAMTYTFSRSTLVTVGGKTTIALPWGSWKIYRDGALLTPRVDITASGTALTSGGNTGVSNGVLTLDPRTVLIDGDGNGDDDDDDDDD